MPGSSGGVPPQNSRSFLVTLVFSHTPQVMYSAPVVPHHLVHSDEVVSTPKEIGAVIQAMITSALEEVTKMMREANRSEEVRFVSHSVTKL